jgi:hypothetical protein
MPMGLQRLMEKLRLMETLMVMLTLKGCLKDLPILMVKQILKAMQTMIQMGSQKPMDLSMVNLKMTVKYSQRGWLKDSMRQTAMY